MFSPLTIASYVSLHVLLYHRICVKISCNVYAAPYASSAHTPPSHQTLSTELRLPPSGCCVTSEYVLLNAHVILSITMCASFNMYITPTEIRLSNGSPVRPS